MASNDRPVNLQEELVKYLVKKQSRRYKVPEVGVYYPSTLVQYCPRGPWNFYMMALQDKKLPDSFILHMAEGNVWHDLMEDLRIWDSTEQSCKKRVDLEDGSHIWIRGRYDAVRGDTVYDFKRTDRVPWGYKPKFEHVLQINFYMECLGKPKGVIAYIGTLNGQFGVYPFYHVLSDWHTQLLVNKAIALHTHLVYKSPPICSCRTKQHEIEWEHYVTEVLHGKTQTSTSATPRVQGGTGKHSTKGRS